MNTSAPRLFPLLRLNAAEAVFAPFHDPEFTGDLQAELVAENVVGVRLTPGWDRRTLAWDTASTGGRVTLRVPGTIRHVGFDHFVFCLGVPPTVRVRFEALAADTDAPLALTDWTSGRGTRMEITAPTPAGRALRGVQAVFDLPAGPGASIVLNWFGLGDSRRLETVTRFDPPYGEDWTGLLVLPDTWPEQTPFQRGLLFADADLPALRAKAQRPEWAPLFASMETRARVDLDTPPERWLGDHVPWTDTRYLRARQAGGRATFNEALVTGYVALIKRDLGLARHALRHLFTIIHTRDWAVSDEMRLQGSAWDQRCFHEEMVTTAVALLADWYAWALTPRARSLILQAIWDKGVAVIERDLMKFEYVHHINQGPWFCRACILGGLLLEQTWPRTGDLVERAKKTLLAGLDNYILDDGGTDEGLGYFGGTLETTLGGLAAYARARGVSTRSLLPPQMERSTRFVAALSALRPGRVLLDGDNSDEEPITDAIPILAGLYPEQDYLCVAAASLPMPSDLGTYYRQYYGSGVYASILGPAELPPPACIVPEFARLPTTGHLTSLRHHAGRPVRLHLAGAKARASHSHLDKGNLTLELGGVPVLIDRGVLRYDDLRSAQLKDSSRHNVITPADDDGVFPDQAPVTEATIPEGEGDALRLHARIDLANVWREHMRSCERRVDADEPLRFTVTDAGALARPGRVAFHLQSLTRFEILDARRVRLSVPESGATLEIVADWSIDASQSVDLVDCRKRPVHHLVLLSEPFASAFELKTCFHIDFV